MAFIHIVTNLSKQINNTKKKLSNIKDKDSILFELENVC